MRGRDHDTLTLRRRTHLAAIAALVAVALTAGCQVDSLADIPADPRGTLDRVEGGFLRVGVSPNPPWTDLPEGLGDPLRPSGREVELVEDFAESLDAEVVWAAGSEEELLGDLETGALDVVVGGLTARSPWASHAALTRPYASVPGEKGEEELHVMATPMGENAFLVALERFLLAQDVGG
ncbi:transporter substrate-binding domain-containing protein [Cellulomonas carbonis]|uniref:transporter substrate-binding domain-containing protein n=1 Tax=Cellulomonas carbonis TaxID=1386092 RepID=UPI000A7D0B6D|nr:transporter substrate-binding domain-containing protein [Cellulomonas carbonis]GGC17188.1 ABC transporter substrate-binding protein [Cellulomonas carbonis]